jgi:hypothetical protein
MSGHHLKRYPDPRARGLRDERLVVLGRAAGQDVRGVLEVERRLDDGPPAGHVVEPVVQGGEDPERAG